MRRRGTLTLAAAIGSIVACGLGFSVAAARSTPTVVTIHVPGARTISVYCGGDDTVHADGDEAQVEPATSHCHIEAPLSPVMPLRGELQVGASDRVECLRENMTLICR